MLILDEIIEALVDNNIIDDNEDKRQAVTRILEKKFRDTIFFTWNLDDIYQKAEEMDVELDSNQGGNVLAYLDRNFDANIGINWDIVENAINNEVG